MRTPHRPLATHVFTTRAKNLIKIKIYLATTNTIASGCARHWEARFDIDMRLVEGHARMMMLKKLTGSKQSRTAQIKNQDGKSSMRAMRYWNAGWNISTISTIYYELDPDTSTLHE